MRRYKMKSLIRIVSLLLLISLAFCAVCEAPEEDLKAKYEERVFKCLNTLTKYLVDDLSVYGTTNEFVKGSNAWKLMFEYDGGWFAGNNGKKVLNLRTDGWEKVSDTEFCVNVYCDYEVLYLSC